MEFIFPIFGILFYYSSLAQNTVEKDTALNTCTVVFFSRFHPEDREIRFSKYPVFINDSLVGKVGQNRYLVVKTTPGKQDNCSSNGWKKAAKKIPKN